MEDQQIVQLYWDRDEDAISATAESWRRRSREEQRAGDVCPRPGLL